MTTRTPKKRQDFDRNAHQKIISNIIQIKLNIIPIKLDIILITFDIILVSLVFVLTII